nr:hypothetical protein [Candidatus Sigynarchaeota archaeon]
MPSKPSLIDRGIVKFIRKPAKLGPDYILSIPRDYIRNGIVDVSAEYDVYMKKRPVQEKGKDREP